MPLPPLNIIPFICFLLNSKLCRKAVLGTVPSFFLLFSLKFSPIRISLHTLQKLSGQDNQLPLCFLSQLSYQQQSTWLITPCSLLLGTLSSHSFKGTILSWISSKNPTGCFCSISLDGFFFLFNHLK